MTERWTPAGQAALLEALSAATNVTCLWLDANGQIQRVEGEPFALLELPAAQLSGKSVFELLEQQEQLQQAIWSCIGGADEHLRTASGGRLFEHYLHKRHEDDGALWVALEVGREQAAPLKHAQVDLAAVARTAALEEINHQLRGELDQAQRHEQALRQEEERYRLLFQSTLDAVAVLDGQGFLVDCNLPLETLYGWRREQVLGKSLIDLLLPPRYHAALRDGMARAQREGSAPLLNKRVELTVLHADGRELPAELTLAPLRSSLGLFFSATIRDIRERLDAGLALRQSEQRTRLVLESALDAVIVLDEQGIIREWNPRAEELFGWPHDEAVGRSLVQSCIAPGYRRRLGQWMTRLVAQGQGPEHGRRMQVQALRRNEREFTAELSLSALHVGARPVLGLFVRDVTEREAAAEQLRETTQRLETMVRSAPLAVIVLDAYEYITVWNPGAERLYGWSEEELLGQQLPTVPEGLQDEALLLAQRVAQGESLVDVDVLRQRRDGTLVRVVAASAPLYDASGNYTGRMVLDSAPSHPTSPAKARPLHR